MAGASTLDAKPTRRPWWRTANLVMVLIVGLFFAFQALFYLSYFADPKEDWLNIFRAIAGLLFAGSAAYKLNEHQPL